MNPLDSFTVERLEELSNCEGWPKASHVEMQALAKIALAAKQAKPVAEVYQPANIGICAPLGVNIRMFAALEAGTKLYATPPLNYLEIPEGWLLVPKELTDDIAEAIAKEARCCGGIALDIYEAMLAAAPKPE